MKFEELDKVMLGLIILSSIGLILLFYFVYQATK